MYMFSGVLLHAILMGIEVWFTFKILLPSNPRLSEIGITPAQGWCGLLFAVLFISLNFIYLIIGGVFGARFWKALYRNEFKTETDYKKKVLYFIRVEILSFVLLVALVSILVNLIGYFVFPA